MLSSNTSLVSVRELNREKKKIEKERQATSVNACMNNLMQSSKCFMVGPNHPTLSKHRAALFSSFKIDCLLYLLSCTVSTVFLYPFFGSPGTASKCGEGSTFSSHRAFPTHSCSCFD